MLELFSKPNCPNCVLTKTKLLKAGIPFEEKIIDEDMGNLKKACDQLKIDYKRIKAAPVLIDVEKNLIMTGADCVVAVEEDEL